MVLQYKLKTEKKWKKYPRKDKIKVLVSKCDFRLLNKDKTKVLVGKASYIKVIKRLRQIESFKKKKENLKTKFY